MSFDNIAPGPLDLPLQVGKTEGFRGYAIDLIDLRPEHQHLRMSVFWALFKDLAVFDDEESAKRALDVLYSKDVRSRFHACDTEVTDITLKRSPYGQGHVTCATVFAGPDIDFGTGPKLFIENLDRSEGILNEFKDYFEDPTVKKVWHNYSFDRAVLFNHGISCAGLGGDTMHMARL